MTQSMLKTKLYQKIFSEQELFKVEVMLLSPVEMLDKVYEYVCREDILLLWSIMTFPPDRRWHSRNLLPRWLMSVGNGMARRKATTWKISEMQWKPMPMTWCGLILLNPREMRGDVPWHTFLRK